MYTCLKNCKVKTSEAIPQKINGNFKIFKNKNNHLHKFSLDKNLTADIIRVTA